VATRILLISDVHFSYESMESEQMWFPPHVTRMSTSAKARKYLAYWDRVVDQGYRKMLCRAQKQGPFDLVISLGDNTPGTNERGLLTEKAQQRWGIFLSLLRDSFPNTPMRFVWGGHEVGYLHHRPWFLPRFFSPERLMTGVAKKDGLTRESFQVVRTLVGPPWQEIKIAGVNIFLLNSEILHASRKSGTQGTRAFAEDQERQQADFLATRMAQTETAIIAVHDATQLKHLSHLIPVEKVELTLAGHFHLPSLGELYSLLPQMWGWNLKVVPSPTGWMFPWGVIPSRNKFCVLRIGKDHEFCLRYCR